MAGGGSARFAVRSGAALHDFGSRTVIASQLRPLLVQDQACGGVGPGAAIPDVPNRLGAHLWRGQGRGRPALGGARRHC